MMLGKLKKKSYLETINNLRILVPRGTLVSKINNEIVYFINGYKPKEQPMRVFKVNNRYFVRLWDTVFQLAPFNPRPPFPLSRL